MKTINTNTSLNELNPAEFDRLVRYHEARGRMLRSDAMKRGMNAVFASIGKGFRSVAQIFSGAPTVAAPRSGAA